jgi:hypothetical protein
VSDESTTSMRNKADGVTGILVFLIREARALPTCACARARVCVSCETNYIYTTPNLEAVLMKAAMATRDKRMCMWFSVDGERMRERAPHSPAPPAQQQQLSLQQRVPLSHVSLVSVGASEPLPCWPAYAREWHAMYAQQGATTGELGEATETRRVLKAA